MFLVADLRLCLRVWSQASQLEYFEPRSLLDFRNTHASLTSNSVPELWALHDNQFPLICQLVSSLEEDAEECTKKHDKYVSSAEDS